jgi:FkbM family methyltransferase
MKIVQIGACRGNDHVTKLIENQHVDFLLLIEANPFNIDSLKQCYANRTCIVENIVVTADLNADSIPFYYSTADGPGYEVSSIKKSHPMMYYREDEIEEIVLPAISLDSLLQKYNINYLDYLFLDIEGIDAEVSLSLNLEKYDIKHVQVEFLHLGERQNDVINHFQNSGYSLYSGIDLHGYDKMFIKN